MKKTILFSVTDITPEIKALKLESLPPLFQSKLKALYQFNDKDTFDTIRVRVDRFAQELAQHMEDTYPEVEDLQAVLYIDYTLGSFLEQSLAAYGFSIFSLGFTGQSKPILIEVI